MPESMRAWKYNSASAGLENAIKLVEEPVPPALLEEKQGYELVEVVSMSLNPGEIKVAERLWMSWPLVPKPASPGLDFSGRAVGGPRDGKRVFGRLDMPSQHGSLAQYMQAKSACIVEIPKGVSYDDAAALGTGAISAYQTLVPFIDRKKGARVFINGGSGGVGTFAVQIAKLLGCYTVVSCSERNVELCRSLGADEVLDYTKLGSDVGSELARRVKAGTMQEFDLAVDNVGRDLSLHRKSEGFLKEEGQFVLLAASDDNIWGVWSMLDSWLRPRWLGGVRRKWKFVLAYEDLHALEEIRDWVAQGRLKSVIDEVFEFEDAPRAIMRMKSGKAVGKVVVTGISSS
ncbi:uncharacterized protein HMPREF1541_01478 [Cyphellophora europaea CBS 101466]|uniref:Enoyl reductase (ER) domain-containing protein n=1 Tax=Cyphellophora europaea (strain CBS 101466) TaxID=1220924 RepID=W2S2Y7_CYPE1|nr:uncharacterized protein HMPREF1541_01478 [Cyphellophora europaea CBS 101466]ETN42324.1 hypothetical protein HMPREF1541_01478 [Cyphellophora europaea CBS 101466]